MKIFDTLEQGSEEWIKVRGGVPTASNFSKILTSTTLKPSSSAKTYMYQLLAESMGAFDESYKSEWMERGNEIESEARTAYEFLQNETVCEVGFVLSDNGYGCSPDGVIYDENGKIIGGLEIKSPKASTHVKNILNKKIPSEYFLQVVGSMLTTGAEWWDFMSYHPELPPMITRVHRKDVQDVIDTLDDALIDFIDELKTKKKELDESIRS